MIQDIEGILPPKEFTLGKRYSFLQDIKNAGSYKDSKDERGTQFEVSAKDVYGALMIRNLNLAEEPSIVLPNEVATHTLWGTLDNIITACEEPSNPNPACYIALRYLFLEADAAILDDVVPEGIRLADGVLTFRDWTVEGDSPQPYAISLDETKVVLRCHLGSSIINMDELKTWISFANVSDKAVTLLTYFEYQNLIAGEAYGL